MTDDIIAISSQGRTFTKEGERTLPRKQPLHHRWIAVVSYTLSPEQAEGVHEPGNKVLFDESNIWDIAVGCIDCEEPYPVVKDKRCRAPEYRPPG